MSHFTVMVIGDNPHEQLEPFNENTEVEQYVKYTKEQLIQKFKDELKDYKETIYAEYLADPEAYTQKAIHNPAHIDYVRDEFPKRLEWSDEEIYKYEISDYEEDDITPDGGVYSTYNPQSKWDWYTLGGRWSGLIKLKDKVGASGIIGQPGVFENETGIDQANKGDIANLDELSTFAVLKDGKWYEKAQMHWFAITSDDKPEEDWNNEIKTLLADVPDDTLISIYDCHI